MMQLSSHAQALLLTARRSVPGAILFRTNPPAAYRELRDNGLVNSHVALTRRGADVHAHLLKGDPRPMPAPERYAYATDDQAVLDAYRAAKAARHEFSQRLLADAAAIGHNIGPLVRKAPAGGEEIIGLKPDSSHVAPIGWKFTERGNRLAPTGGHLGNQARAWLATHQPPAGTDPFVVLLGHGLVPLSRVEHGRQPGDNYTDFRPVVFEWDDKLWACYRGHPINAAGQPTEPSWAATPIEDCLIALARAEGAANAHAN